MNASILVAEDDELIRSTIRRSLEQRGYDVCEAANGAEAIRALRAEPFDLVITDILMPEKDGLETIRHLRKELPAVKIIAISGNENQLFLDSASGLGATRSLAKPFRPSELLELVAELLEPAPVGAEAVNPAIPPTPRATS